MPATKTIKSKPAAKVSVPAVIYVTRDIERALGMNPGKMTLNGKDIEYFIVANKTPYSSEMQSKFPDHVFLIEKNESSDAALLDTYDLLADTEVEEFIADKKDAHVLVFKNTSRIETYCAKKKWHLLNPSADLAEKVENKITQVEWLDDLAKYLPTHEVLKVSNIVWGKTNADKAPFIIQWAHSHTGDGTALVRSDKELKIIKDKFPERDARVTAFIKGPMFTANICVAPSLKKSEANIFIGNISYQITGVLPFTDNPFSTIGNDWSVPHSVLSPERIAEFNEIALAIGQKMSDSGWQGLFGIDCIYDEERDSIHLIEINARQPASTTYESQLQETFRGQIENQIFSNNLTTFEGHVASLLDQKIDQDSLTILEINDGAQIIQRLTESANIIMESPEKIIIAVEALHEAGFHVIEYSNTKANSDLLRIQSLRGIMEAHLKFNARGKKIVDILLG